MHRCRETDLILKQRYQRKFEEQYPELDFVRIFWTELSVNNDRNYKEVMMTGQDLIMDLQETLRHLEQSLDSLSDYGLVASEADNNYKMERSKQMVIERTKGTPVSILEKIVDGYPQVAALNFAKNMAEKTYQNELERINVWKLKARILDAQIARVGTEHRE